MKLVLTRHTNTEWNSLGRMQGHTDINLSPQGRREAERLAQELVSLGIQEIVSSDLRRAQETAEIINLILRVPLRLDARLRECSFGRLEGLTKDQIKKEFNSLLSPDWELRHSNYDFRFFGGEHRESVLARHWETLNSFLASDPDKLRLIVGHGRGLSTLLAELGYPPELNQGEYRLIEFS